MMEISIDSYKRSSWLLLVCACAFAYATCLLAIASEYQRSHVLNRSLGGDVRQDPPHGKLFCLACMHARTRARTHSRVRSVWVCQIVRSVCLSSAFQVLRVFAVFLDLRVNTPCFFEECLEDFA